MNLEGVTGGYGIAFVGILTILKIKNVITEHEMFSILETMPIHIGTGEEMAEFIHNVLSKQ